jgi:hypothetical protein
MGITSSSTAPRVASVWDANEPTPIATVTPISASAKGSRAVLRRHAK